MVRPLHGTKPKRARKRPTRPRECSYLASTSAAPTCRGALHHDQRDKMRTKPLSFRNASVFRLRALTLNAAQAIARGLPPGQWRILGNGPVLLALGLLVAASMASARARADATEAVLHWLAAKGHNAPCSARPALSDDAGFALSAACNYEEAYACVDGHCLPTGGEGEACRPHHCGLLPDGSGFCSPLLCNPGFSCVGGACEARGFEDEACLDAAEAEAIGSECWKGHLVCDGGVCVDGKGRRGMPCLSPAEDPRLYKTLCEGDLGCVDGLCRPVGGWHQPCTTEALVYSTLEDFVPPSLTPPAACDDPSLWCQDGECREVGGHNEPCHPDRGCNGEKYFCVDARQGDPASARCRFASGEPYAPCASGAEAEQLGGFECVDGFECSLGVCHPMEHRPIEHDLWSSAWLAAWASKAAYCGNADAEARLRYADLTRRTFFSTDWDTQAVLADNQDLIVLSVRGSQEPADWFVDVGTRQIRPPWDGDDDYGVHHGFAEAAYGLYEDVLRELRRSLAESQRPIWVVGHSLGGAIAQLVATQLVRDGLVPEQIITFGAPQVGDDDWVDHYADVGLTQRTSLWVNDRDVIARYPTVASPLGYAVRHINLFAGLEDYEPVDAVHHMTDGGHTEHGEDRIGIGYSTSDHSMCEYIAQLEGRLPRWVSRHYGGTPECDCPDP